MQIVIPMTGYGSRFVAAGYKELKPFIKVNGKPIIEWVMKMFPLTKEDKVIFICREEHLNTLNYIEPTLKKISPDCTIFSIKNWVKKGPAYDILQAIEVLDKNSSILISYCDYYMLWDFNKFKQDVAKNNCSGAIPCYTGFHPHLINKYNLYASCKVDDNNNLIEIKEKFSFNEDKTKALHSPGVYYFKDINLLEKYYNKAIKEDNNIKGEYYCSTPYNYLVQDNLKVWCPVNVEFFCQWGTPEDLEEYLFWINTIKNQKRN